MRAGSPGLDWTTQAIGQQPGKKGGIWMARLELALRLPKECVGPVRAHQGCVGISPVPGVGRKPSPDFPLLPSSRTSPSQHPAPFRLRRMSSSYRHWGGDQPECGRCLC